MADQKSLADRITSAAQVIVAIITSVGLIDAAAAKLFHKDSLLFEVAGVGVKAPPPAPNYKQNPAPPRPEQQASAVPKEPGSSPSTATPVKAAPPPEPAVEPVVPTRFNKPEGEFRRQGERWIEISNGAQIASFEQQAVEDGQVVLWDASRQMYLRLPLQGGRATWSYANPISWTDLFYVTPADPSG